MAAKASTAVIDKDIHGRPFLARVQVRHDFTIEEFKECTEALTSKMKQVDLKVEAIKAASATAKSEVKTLQSEVSDLANQLRNGYKTVEVDALIEFKRKLGKKVLRYNSPGKAEHKKVIREEAMSEQDYELLPMDQPRMTDSPEPAPETPPAASAKATEPVEKVYAGS